MQAVVISGMALRVSGTYHAIDVTWPGARIVSKVRTMKSKTPKKKEREEER